jgi:hypothetical protein
MAGPAASREELARRVLHLSRACAIVACVAVACVGMMLYWSSVFRDRAFEAAADTPRRVAWLHDSRRTVEELRGVAVASVDVEVAGAGVIDGWTRGTSVALGLMILVLGLVGRELRGIRRELLAEGEDEAAARPRA